MFACGPKIAHEIATKLSAEFGHYLEITKKKEKDRPQTCLISKESTNEIPLHSSSRKRINLEDGPDGVPFGHRKMRSTYIRYAQLDYEPLFSNKESLNLLLDNHDPLSICFPSVIFSWAFPILDSKYLGS